MPSLMNTKRFIKKLAKYLLPGFGILCLLLFVIVHVVAILLGTGKGRDYVLRQINSAILGQVSISDISLSPFSGGISIRGIGLDGPDGSPIAKIGSLDADIGWLALLKGQILVTEVKLNKPVFHIFETIGGQLNLMTIFRPSMPSGSESGGGLPLNIIIKDVRIDEGVAVYSGLSIKAAIAGLKARGSYNLGLGSGSLKLEIPAAMLDVPGFRTGFAPAVLEADLKNGEVTRLSLDAVTGFGRLALRGGIKDLFTNPFFDLTLNTFVGLNGIKNACGLDMTMNGTAAAIVRATGTIGDPEAYVRLACSGGKFGTLMISGGEAEAYMKDRLSVIRLITNESGGGVYADGYTDLASAFPFSFFTEKSDIQKMAYGIDAKARSLRLKSLFNTGETLESGNISGSLSCDFKGVSLSKMTGSASANIKGQNLAWTTDKSAEKKLRKASLKLGTKMGLRNGLVDVRSLDLEAAGSKINTIGWLSIPSDSFSASLMIDSPDLEKLADVSGIIKAAGSLKADAELSGTFLKPVVKSKIKAENLRIEGFTLGSIDLDAFLDEKGELEVSKLYLKNRSTELTASGNTIIYDTESENMPYFPSDFKMELRNFDPAFFMGKDLPFSGIFDASLSADNRSSKAAAKLKAEGKNLSASGIRIGNASLTAGLSKGVLDIEDLSVKNRESYLSLAASLALFTGKGFDISKDPAINAMIKKASLRIEDFFPQIEGLVTASGSLSGTMGDPSGGFDIIADKLIFDKIKIRSAGLKAAIKGKRIDLESLDIHPVEKETLGLTGWIEKSGDYSLNLDTKGISLYNFRDAASLSRLAGTVSSSLSGKGNISNPEISGTLSFSGLGSNAHAFRDFSLKLSLLDRLLKIESIPDGDLFNSWADFRRKIFGGSADFKGMDLGPFFRAAGFVDFKGKTDVVLSYKGSLENPDQLTADAEIRDFDLNYRDFDLATFTRFKALFKSGVFTLNPSDIRIMKKGSFNASGKWDVKSGLDFKLKSSLPLDDAAPLISDILPDIEGVVTAQASIRGKAQSPEMKGEIALNNVGFTIPETFQKLHDLSGKISLEPRKMVFERIRGLLDDGSFSLTGNADLEGFKATDMDLRLRTRNFPVRVPDAAELLCNIDLSLTGGSDDSFLSGEAVILEGVYYKDVDLSLISMPSRPVRKKPPFWESIENPFLKNMGLDISFRKREPFMVDNNFAKLELSPDLRLTGKVSAPVISGRCKVDSGTIYYRKNEYEVKKGVIDFINPYTIEPEFDIESSSKIRKWTVTLKISGTPDKLSFDLSSDPPLDDNDILSLVILGNVSKDVSAGQAAQRPASEMLGEILASTFSEEIKSVSGLDILETGGNHSQEDDLTSVTIGKTLSRRLAVKYSVDSKAGEISQKATAEYKLLENLILNGFRDSQGIYGGELKYRLEFR